MAGHQHGRRPASWLVKELYPAGAARRDHGQSNFDPDEYQGPDRARAISVIREYYLSVLGHEPDAIHVYRERPVHGNTMYRVVICSQHRCPLVFWVSSNGHIVTFADGPSTRTT